jgi:hypothetical protein
VPTRCRDPLPPPACSPTRHRGQPRVREGSAARAAARANSGTSRTRGRARQPITARSCAWRTFSGGAAGTWRSRSSGSSAPYESTPSPALLGSGLARIPATLGRTSGVSRQLVPRVLSGVEARRRLQRWQVGDAASDVRVGLTPLGEVVFDEADALVQGAPSRCSRRVARSTTPRRCRCCSRATRCSLRLRPGVGSLMSEPGSRRGSALPSPAGGRRRRRGTPPFGVLPQPEAQGAPTAVVDVASGERAPAFSSDIRTARTSSA